MHPGLMKSQLGERAEISKPLRAIFGVYGAMGEGWMQTRGLGQVFFCAASPEMRMEQSGTYFQKTVEAGWQSGMAKNLALATKLEEWTKEEMKKEGWVK